MKLPPPNGCAHCGTPESIHSRRWTDQAKWHYWTEPSNEQRAARILARRDLEAHGVERRARDAELARIDAGPEPTEAELAAYRDAIEVVRENQPYEPALVSEIRERDAAAGTSWREMTADSADRRILLGLYDNEATELVYAIEEADAATEHLGNVEAACARLLEHARLLAASDKAGAEGMRRAVNVITRALHAPLKEEGSV